MVDSYGINVGIPYRYIVRPMDPSFRSKDSIPFENAFVQAKYDMRFGK